jgi:hypothetical protein
MPRPRRDQSPVVIPSNSMVASAVRYPGKAARIYNPTGDWQREAYRHYSICGEARASARFFGHALSRAVLGIGSKQDGQVVTETSGPAVDALNELFNGPDGQTQMLEAIGVHLTIAGECYLVGRKVQPDENTDATEVWEIVSVLEMFVVGNNWSIRYGDNQTEVRLGDDDVVIRIWMPNPARRIEADSSFRSLLPILTEIEYLTKHVFAQVQSRLAGAGVWVLPQSLTFPPPPEVDGKPAAYENEAQGAMLVLGDAMITPIADPSSPTALVPVIFQVPDDQVSNVQPPIHFWTELDAEAKELRREAITRFAIGMDLPPEQILGMSSNSGTGGGRSAGVSHWGAWQIEESTIKMHVEPMLETVTNALTIGYLRPVTGDTNDVVTYDTSALRLRPDRSKEAVEMYDRGVMSMAAMLRENGFPEEDVMSPEELQDWLLRKVASGSATPEMVNAALQQLGVDLGDVGDQAQTPNESRPPPTLDDHPTRPRTPAEESSITLVAACEGLVYRALERAGNRLRQNVGKPPGVPSFETHTVVPALGKEALLLDDAWPCATQVLTGIADPAQVIPVLNAYATMLLTTQKKHDRTVLATWLVSTHLQEAS